MRFRHWCSLFLVCLASTCGSNQPEPEIVEELVISPTCDFYVEGHLLTGIAVATWAADDTIRINGIPVSPPRRPKRVPSERLLKQLYGEIPFIAQRVEEGLTYTSAYAEFRQLEKQISGKLLDAYAKNTTLTEEGRKLAALDVLSRFERSLIKVTDKYPWYVSESHVVLHMVGLRPDEIFHCGQDIDVPDPGTPREIALKRIRSWHGRIADKGVPTVYIIDGAEAWYLGTEIVPQIRAQIESSTSSNLADGPLGEETLSKIVKVRDGD